jgi:NAD-dependent dihydropyrimidine dehydrogenase PreA subunit
MTRVEYVGTGPKNPKVTASNRRNSECTRLTNGLHADPDCCDRCRNRIRACKTRAYRVRDESGRVITDWLIR